MFILLSIIPGFVLVVYIFMQQEKFGKTPQGERANTIINSPNFRNGQFQNLSHTPDLTEGANYYTILKQFLFERPKRRKPIDVLPSHKTNLLTLDPNKNIVVWFGHSSYFMQIDGKKILVDPVLSGSASPVWFTTKSFNGSDIYHTDEIPEIDCLFISHDHWDHLDHKTLKALKPKIKKIICGLGVAQHLEHWGFDSKIIIEKDWNEEVILDDGFKVHTASARHFSGRGFKRNQSLWLSYIYTTPSLKIYIGGDSGYDTHFENIGNEHGPFDLAILECGQYDKSWKYIHMMPEEVVKAAHDLRAQKLMPVHWSKFSLGNHDWDDSIVRVHKASTTENMPIITPMIGEEVNLNELKQYHSWWQHIK